MASDKTTIWTAANIVTVFRIVFIPIFVFVLMAPWPEWFPFWKGAAVAKPWLSAAVFALLSATDGVDGYLARSRNEVTTLGKFLDPLADKILVCAALLALCELGTLPSWVALIIVAREFIISGLRMVASVEGVVIAASWYGKAKTFVTIIAIILFIIKDSALIASVGVGFASGFNVFSWFVMIVAVLLTLLSMVDYFAKTNDQIGLFVKKGEGSVQSQAKEELLDIDELSKEVNGLAKGLGLTVATAESCTGGMVASALTDIPGSSAMFKGSVVSYSNDVKIGQLGVRRESLDLVGAVSSEVAEQMAIGVRKHLDTDLSVATTGVAGPDGGSADKPVGLVWFALATANGCTSCKKQWTGSREEIRCHATIYALDLLRQELLKQQQ